MQRAQVSTAIAPGPPPRAQDYHARSAVRGFGLISFQWLTIAGAVLAAEWSGHWLIYLASVWIIGGRMIALAEVIGHDSVHFNLFPRRSWNEALQWLWFTPLFENWRSYREDHQRHHARLLTPDDPAYQDFARWGLLGPDGRRRMFWKWFIRPFLCFDTLYMLQQIAENWQSDRAYRERVLGFWLLALATAIALGRPDALVWYWLVPLFWVYPALNFWSETGEHYNLARGETRNNFGLLEWLFISPHSDRYHAVHHRYPRIPGFRLAAAAKALGVVNDYENSRGFLDLYRKVRRPPAHNDAATDAGAKRQPASAPGGAPGLLRKSGPALGDA